MKNIRVALSGSGFKFPAHVGALEALEDAGYNIVELAGTSGGSIIAALYACGMKLKDMHDLTMERDWSDMLRFDFLSAIPKMGYCRGRELLAFISEHTHYATFEELDMDLTVVASDISASHPYIFNRANTPTKPIALACRASASIPFVYTPIRIGKAYLMDGGLVNNIAIDRLKQDAVPRLGIQLVSAPEPLRNGLHTVFDVGPRVVDLMLSSNENTHVEEAVMEGASVVFVETGYASGLDRNMSLATRERLFNAGYLEVSRWAQAQK